VVAVGVFNSRDELLIQQRAVDKVEWPGAWDITAGGSVVAGESSQQGAARELWEEVGIAYDFTGVPPHLTVTSATEFLDIYLIDLDCDPAALQLQTAEVQAVRWAGRDEVLALVDAGTMCRYHKPLVELVFALRRSPGWENQLADGSAVRPGRRPQPGSQPRQNRPI
jgi:isopentenyldiphosphate isomerase